MDAKVFYFTKLSWYIHSWIDEHDNRKITHREKTKIRLRHFWPGSYKIIGETEKESKLIKILFYLNIQSILGRYHLIV